MIDKELLDILVCPETREPVKPAEKALIDSLNARIAAGELKNRANQLVTQRLDGGLVRQDGAVLYPIEDGIPIMLIDEAILLEPRP